MTQRETHNLLGEAVGGVWPTVGWRDVNTVVAVSGGADSVALLRTLIDLKQQTGGAGRLAAAHFNHGLRGDASDADARWVADLCDRLGVPCETGGADERPLVNASEEAARDARYAFLLATAERLGARYVATAHTADDQVETLLMRLIRGSGVAGLAGIPAWRDLSPAVTLVRPLLAVSRSEVVAYLQTLGQPFRKDPSNVDDRYTRNRVRHELLPLLRERFSAKVDEALLALAGQAAETQAVLATLARPIVEAADHGVAPDGRTTLAIPRGNLVGVEPLVVSEALRVVWREAGWPEQAMGRQHWRQLARFAQQPGAAPGFDLPGGVHAVRTASAVVLTRAADTP